MNDQAEPQVKRRAVFFLGGFDPRGGRHYYSLYKQESQKMAEVSGAKIEVSKRKREKEHVTLWQVNYTEKGDDVEVETEYRTLDYDDIIRRHWVKSEAAVIKNMISVYWLIWRKDGFKNEWKVLKPIVYAAAFWFILVICLSLVGIGIAIALWMLLDLASLWKCLCCVAAFMGVWQIGKFLDKKFNHYWLIRGISFSGSQAQYDDPHYEARMEYFTDQVVAADQSGKYDEVLVVGHSSGAIWGMETMARATMKDELLGSRSAEVNLVTLGSCISLMSGTSLNKGSHDYILHMAKSKSVDWLDLSAKIDLGASFMVDPAALIEGGDLPEKHLPRLDRVRYFKMFKKENYSAFKKNGYRVHFQYLMASDLDEDYNYFRLSGGKQSLRQLYPVEG